MMTRRRLLLLFVLFAIAGVLQTPLRVLTPLLPSQIKFKEAYGTVWHGGASAVGLGQTIVQERVEWNFRPQALLAARIEWSLSGRLGTRNSTLTLGLGRDGPVLGEVNVYLPLAPMAALHPRLEPLRLGATVHASAARIDSRSPGAATLQIDDLFSPLVPQSAPLGSYLVDLRRDDDGVASWSLRSLSGVLAASGQGKIDAARQKFSGQLVLNPASPLPGLSPALTQLPRSDAGYLIAF